MASWEWALMVCSILSLWPREPVPLLLLLEAHTTLGTVADLRQDFFGCVDGAESMVLVVGGSKGEAHLPQS